eukprot:1158883-Pelagomonas_calceolata.AAC.5
MLCFALKMSTTVRPLQNCSHSPSMPTYLSYVSSLLPCQLAIISWQAQPRTSSGLPSLLTTTQRQARPGTQWAG